MSTQCSGRTAITLRGYARSRSSLHLSLVACDLSGSKKMVSDLDGT